MRGRSSDLAEKSKTMQINACITQKTATGNVNFTDRKTSQLKIKIISFLVAYYIYLC